MNQAKELYLEIRNDLYNSHLIIIVVLLGIFIVPILYMPESYVKIEMDDIYNEQGEQIPIDVTVTGMEYDYITVNLSKADAKDNLTLVDPINLKINSDPNKVISSKYLIGNDLDHGKYKFYINTTNLSEGYYELSVTTKNNEISMETQTDSFYLV